jgi:hypothetical protein
VITARETVVRRPYGCPMSARTVVKQLVCPRCGDVMAGAEYRRFPPRLSLTALDGSPLPPIGGAVLVRALEEEAARAPAADRAAAEERLGTGRRQLGELIYDLRCPRGHRTVQTMPAIVRAVRRTQGRWVTPR